MSGLPQRAAAQANVPPTTLQAAFGNRGESPSKDDGDLVTGVAKAAGCDATPFIQVVQHRRGTVALKPANAAGVVSGCLDGLQRIVRYLDQYKGRS